MNRRNPAQMVPITDPGIGHPWKWSVGFAVGVEAAEGETRRQPTLPYPAATASERWAMSASTALLVLRPGTPVTKPPGQTPAPVR